MKCNYVIAVIVSILICSAASGSQAFRDEKRIYLVDVTASMEGKGAIKSPNIFSKLKSELSQTIASIDNDSTEVVIIPFTNRTFTKIRGKMTSKDSLITCINNLTVKNGDTNIADAWECAVSEIDTNKVNYLFLLTDGLHNCGPSRKVLYDRLSRWEDISNGKYYFAFYVMLTPEAREQPICEIVDKTQNMWLIESMDVNATFIQTSISQKVNIYNDKKVRIQFTSNNKSFFQSPFAFKIALNDNSDYAIQNVEIPWKSGCAQFEIKELMPKVSLPVEETLRLQFIYDKNKYPLVFFTPEVIDLAVLNMGIREMKIVPGRTSKRALLDFGSQYYQNPYFWPLSIRKDVIDKILDWPIFSICKPRFKSKTRTFTMSCNEDCLRSNSRVFLKFLDKEGYPIDGLDIYFNGKKLDDNFITLSGKSNADNRIDIVYTKFDKSVELNGSIWAEGTNIDKVNGINVYENNSIGDWRLHFVKYPSILLILLLLISAVIFILLVIRKPPVKTVLEF